LKENNLKKLPSLLSKSKKEVKIQPSDKKYFEKFRSSSNSSREKLHPNVVAVLFVTVLNCCC